MDREKNLLLFVSFDLLNLYAPLFSLHTKCGTTLTENGDIVINLQPISF